MHCDNGTDLSSSLTKLSLHRTVITMPSILPSQETLSGALAPQSPPAKSNKGLAELTPANKQQRPLFGAWSVIEDVKHAAEKVEKAAAKDFDKASTKVQSKTGHIEPWTAKYYASCTVGGLMACVSMLHIRSIFISHSIFI